MVATFRGRSRTFVSQFTAGHGRIDMKRSREVGEEAQPRELVICQANIWNSACALSMGPYLIRLLPHSTRIPQAALVLSLHYSMPDVRPISCLVSTPCLIAKLALQGHVYTPLNAFFLFLSLNKWIPFWICFPTCQNYTCSSRNFIIAWVTRRRRIHSVFAWWKLFVVFRENGLECGPKIISVWCGHTLKRTRKVWGLNSVKWNRMHTPHTRAYCNPSHNSSLAGSVALPVRGSVDWSQGHGFDSGS